MEEDNPLKNDRRWEKRKQRLGDNPACVLCGYSKPESLMRVKRELLEAHHPVGRANDAELTVIVCRNCHGELTEKLRDAGVSMQAPATCIERLVSIMKGLASFFTELGRAMLRWADTLNDFMSTMDQSLPDWRKVSEAK